MTFQSLFLPSILVFSLLACSTAQSANGAPAAPSGTSSLTRNAGSKGFDFSFGHWEVSNRRLLHSLQESKEWERFDASIDCRPILGGAGNQDRFLSAHRPGFIGMSLRLYDPKSQQWSIYWVDNQSALLQPPVIARFSGSEGIFEGADTLGGKPILVRYTWSRTDTASPRWEQAFSADKGKNWETNWIMDFHRANPAPEGHAHE